MKFGGGTDAPLAEPAIRITLRGTRGVRIPSRGPVPGLSNFGANLLAEALGRIAAIAPPYTNYQQKTDREIPIVRLSREP